MKKTMYPASAPPIKAKRSTRLPTIHWVLNLEPVMG